MNIRSTNTKFHIAYWFLVSTLLVLVFGWSWKSELAAFYFVSMLLPIVIGTSYFFNYYLVPKLLLKKFYAKFVLYLIYLIIISLYLEVVVLIFSLAYFGEFNINNLGPNAHDTVLLAFSMYFIVILWSFVLMLLQLKENQKKIAQLIADREKLQDPSLEFISNRRTIKLYYDEILFIESLSDYIQLNTASDVFKSKERISKISDRLPDKFLRIHRSFIVNLDKVKEVTSEDMLVGNIRLNIGRSYRKDVKILMNNNNI